MAMMIADAAASYRAPEARDAAAEDCGDEILLERRPVAQPIAFALAWGVLVAAAAAWAYGASPAVLGASLLAAAPSMISALTVNG